MGYLKGWRGWKEVGKAWRHWRLQGQNEKGRSSQVEVRVSEAAMDRAVDVVGFQTHLAHILSGAGERARTIRTWLELIAEDRGDRAQASHVQEVKDEAMEGIESPSA